MNRRKGVLERLQSARSGEKESEGWGWWLRETDGGKSEENKWKGNAVKRQREVCRRQTESRRDPACQNQCEASCVKLCASRAKTEIHS